MNGKSNPKAATTEIALTVSGKIIPLNIVIKLVTSAWTAVIAAVSPAGSVSHPFSYKKRTVGLRPGLEPSLPDNDSGMHIPCTSASADARTRT
jgi:hypothetical protein